MNKRWTPAGVLVVCALLGWSCGGGGEPAGGDANSGPQFLSIGTAPQGGAFFPVGGAIAEVLNQNGEAGWQVTAEATKGSQENIRRLDAGEIDLALSNAAITYFAVRGAEEWDKSYPMQAVMTLAPNVAQFLTPANSGIRTIADLRGKRVFVGPSGAGFQFFLRPLLAAHGLTYDDFEPLNGPQGAAVDMLGDGSADVAFLGGAVPTAAITQACASQDIFFIPYDEAARQQLIEQYTFFRPATIARDKYSDLTGDFAGMDVGSMHLITSADADEELVYQITKTIYENREQVVARHAAGRAINEKNVIRDTGVDFHPGAIRYYEEIGIWPSAE